MEFLNKIDKQQVQKITLIVIAALTILALVLLLVIVFASVNPSSPTVDADVTLSNGFSEGALTNEEVSAKNYAVGSLVLADNNHPFSVSDTNWLNVIDCKTYRNQLLREDDPNVDVNNVNNLPYQPYTNMQLNVDAMEAAHKMLNDAVKSVNQGAITIDAAYARQEFKETIGADNLIEFDTALVIFLSDKNSDGNTQQYVPLSNDYAEWLDAHCADYGFINSFKYGYRYVGIEHTQAMSKLNIDNLADYVKYLKDNTANGTNKILDIKLSNDTEYKVYYVSCNAGDTIKVPKDVDAANITISGTNEGGVIVTVKVK